MSIFHNFKQALQDCCFIWREEIKQVAKDEGVLIFFILVPVLYPLLYSWIYNNEVVRDVPVAIVDQSHSSLSRQFIRQCDASPDVHVLCHATDIDEARMLMSRQVVKGFYVLPSDFDTNVGRMQQSVVSVYCDMSLMLTYKAIFQTAQTVAMDMGTEMKVRLGQYYTDRDALVGTSPLEVSAVPIYNPTGGYGSFILPAVLILIIQQTLVLGIGLAAGTARERNRYSHLIPISHHHRGMFRIVGGKAMAYFMIYAVMATYLTIVVPRLFRFTSIGQWQPLLAVMIPYILACIFFGMVVSCLIRYRENVMLLIVFASVPLLFLTGVSWPQSSIPGFWQGLSWLFPSTFGVRAYVRINEMGASLSDVGLEYQVLWFQALAYFIIACLVYRYQLHLSRQAARERHDAMTENRQHSMDAPTAVGGA